MAGSLLPPCQYAARPAPLAASANVYILPKGGAELPRAATDPVYEKYPGLTVADYARQRGHLGRQVIVYSVHDDDAVRAEVVRLGSTYLMKGRPRQFKRELEDVLSYDPLAQR